MRVLTRRRLVARSVAAPAGALVAPSAAIAVAARPRGPRVMGSLDRPTTEAIRRAPAGLDVPFGGRLGSIRLSRDVVVSASGGIHRWIRIRLDFRFPYRPASFVRSFI